MLAGRGKGRIRPPRRGLASPAENVDFHTIWSELQTSLREIHTKDVSKLSFEELYRNAYKLVLKKMGDRLYENVKMFEEKWLREEVKTKIQNLLLGGNIINAATVGIRGMSMNEKRVAGEKYLKGLKAAWEDHRLCMGMTTDVLMYMYTSQDRVYCTDNRKPSIFTAAMGQFRDHILRSHVAADGSEPTTIENILISVILEQIQMEREGDIIDKTLIRSCIYMFEGLYETEYEDENEKIYLTSFELEFLNASRQFYQSEGESLLRNSDAGTYLRHTESRLREEQDRCRSTISPLTATKIKEVVEEELLKRNIRDVIEMEGSGLNFMLDNDRLEDLRLAYNLVSRIDPKKAELQKAFQKRVVEMGAEINKAAKTTNIAVAQPNEKGDSKEATAAPPAAKAAPANAAALQSIAAIKWVDDVLRLKDKYDSIWAKAFQQDQGLQTALNRSFHEFINEFQRSSEYISLFIDENLKRGLKDKTENEVDAVLEKAIVLLRYIQDKDMFERYYKKHLSRRLLMGKSVGGDVEKQMISRMKLELGNHFTQKLEGMFKDIALSGELTAAYKGHVRQLDDGSRERIELSMSVLTNTFWPVESWDSTAKATCIFPPEIERIKAGFENFYLSKHTGRRLTWQPNMGTADIRATFPKSQGKDAALAKERRHEINVSTYAMVVLLLFNDPPEGGFYTFEELQTKTMIPPNDLIRNLQSLAVAPKTRLLIKEPMSKDIKPTDRFHFNESFSSKFLKLKVGVVAGGNKVESEKERKQTEKRNDEMRGGIIEAAVVRIMKERKELPHQQLYSEVISQLRFTPDINMIKKRIESLIEREYLERVEERARPAYRYLA
ncbi:MAG: Cullin-3 [Trichoglossum hirsutum]|nr:MAG: Cullin-3 [Trichoglossum hirsutum]